MSRRRFPDIGDRVGAFVPHGPPPLAGSGQGPLTGLTFAVKDLYDTAGSVTGGGSPDWLRTHTPATQTAGAVQSLLDAGADMVGKTVCDELFYSFTGANAHYGTPLNCRAPDRLPGGSSSGSAAATAAGLCDFALGSDTGGSVRLPASFCGLYGLRATHGRIDLSHAMAMAPSFDAGGWFADDAQLFRRIGPVLLNDARAPRPLERVLIAADTFAWADEAVSAPLERFMTRAAPDLAPITNVAAVAQGFEQSRECFRILQAAEVWRTFGAWVTATTPAFGPGIKARFEAASRITAAQVSEAAQLR
ncbi:MAG: amidase family protein, partial [Steroidobacteraceae bacterium]